MEETNRSKCLLSGCYLGLCVYCLFGVVQETCSWPLVRLMRMGGTKNSALDTSCLCEWVVPSVSGDKKGRYRGGCPSREERVTEKRGALVGRGVLP